MRDEDAATGPCSAPGCETRTRKHKPFCIDHLGLMAYPRALMVQLGTLEASGYELHGWAPQPRICALCGVSFLSAHPRRRYHSALCSNKARRLAQHRAERALEAS